MCDMTHSASERQASSSRRHVLGSRQISSTASGFSPSSLKSLRAEARLIVDGGGRVVSFSVLTPSAASAASCASESSVFPSSDRLSMFMIVSSRSSGRGVLGVCGFLPPTLTERVRLRASSAAAASLAGEDTAVAETERLLPRPPSRSSALLTTFLTAFSFFTAAVHPVAAGGTEGGGFFFLPPSAGNSSSSASSSSSSSLGETRRSWEVNFPQFSPSWLIQIRLLLLL
mmetsp:Transcript_53839/g.87163  ORF Transcript_53839/g.87163 Transcript_53839/m.87163 type:complete len:229 (+) Transcript_53839:44-730(+)